MINVSVSSSVMNVSMMPSHSEFGSYWVLELVSMFSDDLGSLSKIFYAGPNLPELGTPVVTSSEIASATKYHLRENAETVCSLLLGTMTRKWVVTEVGF